MYKEKRQIYRIHYLNLLMQLLNGLRNNIAEIVKKDIQMILIMIQQHFTFLRSNGPNLQHQ